MGKIQIISGSAHPRLARQICSYLKIKLTPVQIEHFADGEIYVKIKNKVRGDDVFIIQSMAPPINDHLMELLIMIDALKRASADRINVVCPYLCYSRQERKASSREPISAKLVADLITKAGATRLLTVDLHADAIQGFYDIPVDHFVGYPKFVEYLEKKKYKDLVVVSPDVGGMKRGRAMAKLLNVPLAVIDKRRPRKNRAEVLAIIGEIKNKTCIVLDDIIDTAGTISNVTQVLKDRGAKEVIICATHALFSGEACKKINGCPASKVLLLDTLPLAKEKQSEKVEIISLAKLFSKIIRRIHSGRSLGALFDWESKIK
ncbi:MAG: ribose-phosphate pyrophosphokinase [Candidatus Shapirobacteria bacterium]